MNKPIIALDFANQNEVASFLKQFPADESLFVKVGMELFYQAGPDIVSWLKEMGHGIFLDLKCHDIPNTVEHAMEGLGRLGVTMTNVHAAGGIRMMKAAKAGLERGAMEAGYSRPMLIAVTQLTSTTEEEMHHDQGIPSSLLASVCHYAQCTKEAGLDGVVCSAKEAQQIKAVTGNEFQTVCPGIRLAGDSAGDQRRVMTPCQARLNQADYIVVGRSITQAELPYQAYRTIMEQWEEK